jgi:hypothetical protein
MEKIVIKCARIDIHMRAIIPSKHSISFLMVEVLTIKLMVRATFTAMPVKAITFELSLIVKLLRVKSSLLSLCSIVYKRSIIE